MLLIINWYTWTAYYGVKLTNPSRFHLLSHMFLDSTSSTTVLKTCHIMPKIAQVVKNPIVFIPFTICRMWYLVSHSLLCQSLVSISVNIFKFICIILDWLLSCNHSILWYACLNYYYVYIFQTLTLSCCHAVRPFFIFLKKKYI